MYIAHPYFWLIFCLLVPFTEVVLRTAIKVLADCSCKKCEEPERKQMLQRLRKLRRQKVTRTINSGAEKKDQAITQGKCWKKTWLPRMETTGGVFIVLT